MKRVALCLIAVLLTFGVAYAGGHAHWSYSGHEGPAHWGEIDPAFEMCAKGNNQSPINLTGFIESDLAALKIDYTADSKEILNNGHAIQVNVNNGSTLTIDGITFNLLQYHFHAPSENTINGKSFPMESHYVHTDKDGNLAVIAVMYEEGKGNKLMKKLWKKMPEKASDKNSLKKGLNGRDLLPSNKDYYRFNGSLTTPPCTEGVRWFVMKNAVEVSKKQVKEFEHVMHHPTNRPVQPKNARMVLK